MTNGAGQEGKSGTDNRQFLAEAGYIAPAGKSFDIGDAEWAETS